MTSGMPASRMASIPAAIARRVTRSRAARCSAGDAEFALQIEGASATSQLDHVRHIGNATRTWRSPLSLLTRRRMMFLSSMARRNFAGIRADELITAQDAFDIAVVEDVLGSGQSQRRARDDDRFALWRRLLSLIDFPATIKHAGEVGGRVRRSGRRWRGGPMWLELTSPATRCRGWNRPSQALQLRPASGYPPAGQQRIPRPVLPASRGRSAATPRPNPAAYSPHSA